MLALEQRSFLMREYKINNKIFDDGIQEIRKY